MGIEVKIDVIAEKLDEMADLCEIWKKNREKGRQPNAVRSAVLMLVDEIIMEQVAGQIPQGDIDKFSKQMG